MMDNVFSFKLKLGIIILPIIFSWFTLKKCYSNKQRILPFLWLAFTIILIATADKDSNQLGILVTTALSIFLFIECLFFVFKKITQQRKQTSIENNQDLDNRPVLITDTPDNHHDNQSASLNEWKDDLTIIWAGETNEIEFTYESYSGKKSRRKVKPSEVSFDGRKELTIKGICSKSNEERHFKAHNLTTMIKVGSQRYDVHDWAEKYLNVDLYKIDELVW